MEDLEESIRIAFQYTSEGENIIKYINEIEKETKKRKSDFMNGFGAAIGTLARNFGYTTLAENIIKENGFKKEDFKDCDDFDLKIIKKLDI